MTGTQATPSSSYHLYLYLYKSVFTSIPSVRHNSRVLPSAFGLEYPVLVQVLVPAMDDQPPPPPHFVRPPVSRISSWQRVSPPSASSMAPPPPPPPPPHSGDPSEPRSGNGVFTPDMLSEVRKFMDAGGYEGMKRRILEEGELLHHHVPCPLCL